MCAAHDLFVTSTLFGPTFDPFLFILHCIQNILEQYVPVALLFIMVNVTVIRPEYGVSLCVHHSFELPHTHKNILCPWISDGKNIVSSLQRT